MNVQRQGSAYYPASQGYPASNSQTGGSTYYSTSDYPSQTTRGMSYSSLQTTAAPSSTILSTASYLPGGSSSIVTGGSSHTSGRRPLTDYSRDDELWIDHTDHGELLVTIHGETPNNPVRYLYVRPPLTRDVWYLREHVQREFAHTLHRQPRR